MEMNMERQCKHKNSLYTCKRMRLLQHLKENNFLPVMTVPDCNNPKYNVWKFENSPELEDCIESYFRNLNAN